jgi:hypothetical protein
VRGPETPAGDLKVTNTQVDRVIRNKFAKSCFRCGRTVAVQQGWAFSEHGSWRTACEDHLPVAKPVIQSRRCLTAAGTLFTPYEPQNLDLIRSLPGAIWDKEQQCWTVSIDPGDRRRILEVADQLGLEVDPLLREVTLSGQAVAAQGVGGIYPFQVDGIDFLSQRTHALLADDMGLGKAQPLTARLLTPTGWKLMGEVQVGDVLVSPFAGLTTRVVGVYPQGVKPIYRVTFSDGSSTECCDDHLWQVQSANQKHCGRSGRVLPLREIRDRLRDAAGNCRHFIPLVQAVAGSLDRLPLDPYLLGVILGNACLTQNTPTVVLPDEESVERVRSLLPEGVVLTPREGSAIHFGVTGTAAQSTENPLTQILRDLGLYGKGAPDKAVPDCYLFASVADRTALLQGLLDTDGWVSDNLVGFSSSSEQLTGNVIQLVRSLGGTATYGTKQPWYTYKGERRQGLTAHVTTIALPQGVDPFRLTRKAANYSGRPKYQPTRAIVRVDYVGDREAQCIAVDAPHHLYVTDDYIVTHNTLQSLLAIPTGAQTLVVVPSGLRYNWAAEARRWRPDLKVTVLEGRNLRPYRWDVRKERFRSAVTEASGRLVPEVGELLIVGYDILPEYLIPLKPGVLSKEELVEQTQGFVVEALEQLVQAEDRRTRSGETPWTPEQQAAWITAQVSQRVRRRDLAQKAAQAQKKDTQGNWINSVSRTPQKVRDALQTVTLIVDEAHNLRNYDSGRSKKVKELSRLVGRVYGLTGTPLLNHPEQLYSVLDSLNLAQKTFRYWGRFVELCNGYKSEWGGYQWGQPQPIVPELLRRVMLRRTREEVLPQLPKKTYQTIEVPVSDSSLERELDALYGEYEDYFATADDRDEMPPFEDFSAIRAKLAADRLDTVLELVESYEEQGVPLVVASAHRAVIDAVGARSGWGVITGDVSPARRQEVVAKFQAADPACERGVALTIPAGGVGLTLTRAHTMLFVDLDWTPALNSQCEDRICRIGQTADKCVIIRLVSDHPLDRHLQALLAGKISLITAAVENRIEGAHLRAPAGSVGETPEEVEARLARIAAEVEAATAAALAEDAADRKARAKAKVGGILARLRGRCTRPEVELTPEVKEGVRGAVRALAAVCDFAETLDGQGFGKTDAYLGHTLAATDLETDEELRAAERLCSRYHRQLADRFPVLFVRPR